MKAFDSINREFMYYMLHCMGFPYVWIEWIMECISSPTFLVMVNGSSEGFFSSNRGIRQGDPLSPYLFVLVIEFWSIQMDTAVAKGALHPFKRGVPNQISHLLFADDMLVFCRGSKKSLQELDNLFEMLQLNTGLPINKEKSKVFFSKGCKNKGEMASILSCTHGSFPVKYLGPPLLINYVKSKDFGWLIDKVRSKCEGWMTRVLSFAGRVELAKTVLYGSMSYWLQSVKFPKSVITELERIISNFIWKGGIHSCSWDLLCRPKEGGIGLRRIKDISNAYGIKLLWRVCTSNSLWSEWMNKNYFSTSTLWDTTPKLRDSGTLKFIIDCRCFAAPYMRKSIGNGQNTRLWT